MVEMWQSIVQFHEKFELTKPEQPELLCDEMNRFRVGFLLEELSEYITADTLEDKIDALVDLVVVAMGTAYLHGFEWPLHWEEVFIANMKKERAKHSNQSKRKSQFDVVKPLDWTPPNHKKFYE